jgi:SNF2 family DNA or RNA helicase
MEIVTNNDGIINNGYDGDGDDNNNNHQVVVTRSLWNDRNEALYMRFLNKSKVMYKEYQKDGIKWCVHLETHNDSSLPIHGGFIADEMGLGKTIMMIATMVVNFLPHTLIILPNILMDQWYEEIFKTTNHSALIFHGKNKKTITVEQLRSVPIVITTYSTLSKDCPLFQVNWDRLVFDEAHHLRNVSTRNIRAKLLKTKICWLISGTPIQNKKKDFYNLCSVLKMPASYYTDSNNLQHLVKNFVMKRTKKNVGIEIPDIIFENKNVSWESNEERKLSSDIHYACKLVDKSYRLPLFLQARQCCILPSLLIGKIENMITKKVLPPVSAVTLNKSSSKLNAVISTIIERKDNGNGKIIFCHFKGEIDTIYTRLRENGIKKICIFDGRSSQVTRSKNIRLAYEVIILQIQTGCEGLNLQKHFSEIYFVSPNWNPFIEKQAIARCHRIGQKKNVSVFTYHMNNFIACDPVTTDEIITSSLDHYISHVQSSKIEIVDKILSSSSSSS